MKEKLKHLYAGHELKTYINQYNRVFDLLKVTGNFDPDDKIVDLKRGLVFDGWENIFWDYLDFVHNPVMKTLWKESAYCCIRFILKSWKTVTIAELENVSQKLPQWIHSIEEYAQDVKNYLYGNTCSTYADKVYDILWEIRAQEHEYFHSKAYLDKVQKVNMFELLKLKKI